MHEMVEANFYNLILLLIFILLLIIFKLFTNRMKSNLPPSPPSLPIIGHLHLLSQPIHEKIHTLSRKFGPVMLLRFGPRKLVFVSSSSVVEECFTKSNDIVLAYRPQTPTAKHINYNFITMTSVPYGHLWRSLRRFASIELFSTTHLNSTSHSREHEVKLMCKQILKESSQKVELKSRFFDLFCNVLTMSMMGKRYYGDIIDTGASRFQEMMAELFRLLHAPYLGDFVPILAWIDFGGVQKELVGFMKTIDLILNEVIEERRRVGSYDSGIMLDKFLNLQEQEPELYTDEVIRAHIVIMLITGTEAPTFAVEWAMSLLLNNPTAMEKIKKEIDTHVGSERLLRENDLDKLSYLQNVVSESLRLYPTLAMLLPHEASENIKICGYSVPRGTTLLVNLWAIHRDPAVWDKPNEFMPERFDGKRDDKYKLLPFGVGRRACPATSFGYRMLGLVLGTLIQAFEWVKIGDEEVDMTAIYDTTISKLNPLQALCKPRSNMIDHLL